MFADLMMPEIQVKIATLCGILINKGICTTEEFEKLEDEIRELIGDPDTLRQIADAQVDRRSSREAEKKRAKMRPL